MAATACYVNISHIPAVGGAGDSQSFSNINATTAAFTLAGGLYGVTVKASTYGTVILQVLAADNTTYLAVMSAFLADGYASANLPTGTYKVALA
jgi:hypothetical protein